MPAAVANLRRWRASSPAAISRAQTAARLDVAPPVNGALEQPVVASSRALLRGDAGALAELVEVDLVLVGGEPARRRRRRSFEAGRRELLADHAQRQELVALEPEDRLQPLDVVLAEQPVAAARPLRRQQALVLEVADLRDRDVRELGLQPPADRADRVQPRSRGVPVAVVVIGRGR